MAQIRINLLPWREELKQEKKKEFLILLSLSAGASIIILIIFHIIVASWASTQESVNSIISTEITELDKNIKDIKALQEEKERLLARMDIIQQLQSNRSNNVHIFDEIIRAIPNGLYLSDLELVDNKIIMNGKAESNTRVSRFMRNIEKSTWLKHPNLTVIKADEGKPGAADSAKETKVDHGIDFNLMATLWDQDRPKVEKDKDGKVITNKPTPGMNPTPPKEVK